MASLTKIQAGQIYRPAGPKAVLTGQNWSNGGSLALAQAFDLSLPILGLRIGLRGRIAVATANYTSVNPEGILNLIKRIYVTGTNSRQGGNVTLIDMDLATAWMLNSLFNPQGNLFIVNNVARPEPGTPLITSATATAENSYFLGTTAASPYDFRLMVDIPFHPHGIAALFKIGFGVRQQEFANSLQLQLTYGQQSDNADGALGVSAATTVTSFTAFGSGAGSPVIDIYSLPYLMGLDMMNSVLPGVLSRVNSPVTTPMTTAGSNVSLSTLQKIDTTRLILKQGTSTTNPYFASLNDTNVTAIALTVGGNRVVRELDDIWAHKNQVVNTVGRGPIQGYNLLDFLASGSPFSAYPASQIGGGTLFELRANVTGIANGFGQVIQEQILYPPAGPLYGD